MKNLLEVAAFFYSFPEEGKLGLFLCLELLLGEGAFLLPSLVERAAALLFLGCLLIIPASFFIAAGWRWGDEAGDGVEGEQWWLCLCVC